MGTRLSGSLVCQAPPEKRSGSNLGACQLGLGLPLKRLQRQLSVRSRPLWLSEEGKRQNSHLFPVSDALVHAVWVVLIMAEG